MGKRRNPWRGLASYDDPANNDKQKYDFCGRDGETTQLVKLIDNNLFVTLYGRTGAGKTSLLKAGVFPILRLHNYVPVYIRLAHGEKDKSYAETIVKEIEEKKDIVVKRINDANLINTNGESLTYLWDYFCQTIFFNQEGKEIYPVIALDQFEEIFVTQEKDEGKKAELLLKQINALLCDDLVLLDNENFSDETNYRFVASIREDNLYLLEDCIDEHSLSTLKDNRYRLRPMKEDQAANAILIPGRKCIVEQDKVKLVSLIIEGAKDKDGTISSLMLSFICSQLYEKAITQSSEPQIDVKLFIEHQTESKRLLTDFYLQNTSNKQRKIIEDHFITEDGHRKTSKVNIPHSKELVEKYNILQEAKTEKGDELEIVHDRFAEVIYMHRRQQDSKKLRNVLGVLVGIVLLAFFGFAILFSWSDSINNVPSTIALKKSPRIYPSTSTDTLLNKRTVSAVLDYNTIKNIWIGDSVKFISLLSVNEHQKIFVSPNNSNIKGDYIYRYTDYKADSIFFLYDVNNPQIAIFTQKKIDNDDSLRLPKRLESLEVNGYTRKTASGSPGYGEETIEIMSDKELHFTKGDSRVKNLILDSITRIPSGQYEGCISLEKVDFRVDKIGLGWKCFRSCPNLREVILPKKLNNSYGEEFSFCCNLKKITLPDEVEEPNNIDRMFRWCPNITEVIISEKSHFHQEEDGVIYYDSIPVIFNMCKTKDWVSKDSTIRIIDAIVMKNDTMINILPAHWLEDHFSIISVDKTKRRIGVTEYVIYQNLPSSVINILPRGRRYILYANYNPTLREIHTPIATPDYSIEFIHPNMQDKSNVTLFVPYGCKDAYYDSGRFKYFKDIKEDGIAKRVLQTIEYWWYGIKETFGAYSWLLYPIVFFVLALLLFVFYKLKLYQMSKHGFVSKRKAFLYAGMADIAAVTGFIPVYYTVYWLVNNHYKIGSHQIAMLMSFVLILFAYFVIRLIIDTRKNVLWPWLLSVVVLIGFFFVYLVMKWGDENAYYNVQCICLGSFYGGLSGYVCAYLAAFAGNGKILSKMKRWKFS